MNQEFRTIIKDGNWYKGNTHTHSTLSDGSMSRDEVIRYYQEMDYNFLVMSEHEVYTSTESYDKDHFVLIPGMEFGQMHDKKYYGSILIGTGKSGNLKFHDQQSFSHQRTWSGMEKYNQTIKDMQDAGNLIVVHAPYYNGYDFDDLDDLADFQAIEIYNHICEIYCGRTGYALSYWDYLLRHGCQVWGIASDDLHFDRKRPDFVKGGWIAVKARHLSVKDIAESIKAGSFYASQGPQIHDFYIRDDVIYLECSAVRHFVVKPEYRGNVIDAETIQIDDKNGRMLLAYKPDFAFKYVRVEIGDDNGRTAWSNPIFMPANPAP
jgi:hypothetical protein